MRKLIAGSWKIHGLASSLAEIEALKGLTSEAACDIVVRSPFTPIENPAKRSQGSTAITVARHRQRKAPGACTAHVWEDTLVDGRCMLGNSRPFRTSRVPRRH
ncbi:triose-phosphate isomerase [Rhizobium gallicum]|uniref:triose-phosphate isomerase n=1 Tax=Rhizobium gallicum TaxID=56730 RepID=UPI001EF98601|nr:triose-phosphate isomerase [Rhizobium gallicum]ULJ76421.1 triose-phosphate isomerase [Rhizobium gallicum]